MQRRDALRSQVRAWEVQKLGSLHSVEGAQESMKTQPQPSLKSISCYLFEGNHFVQKCPRKAELTGSVGDFQQNSTTEKLTWSEFQVQPPSDEIAEVVDALTKCLGELPTDPQDEKHVGLSFVDAMKWGKGCCVSGYGRHLQCCEQQDHKLTQKQG